MLYTVIKKNSYQDSVSLMLLTNKLSDMEGINKISIMMGTPANKDIFNASGLLTPEANEAGSNDICIVVDSDIEGIVDNVVEEVNNFIANQANKSKGSGISTVHSWDSSMKKLPDANMALISIPGAYAYKEAERALDRGLNVFIFSDNVSVEEELALKQKAHEKGLLVMGPDCGTGVISGIPIAFANVINNGSIGVIGASGTGIQEVTSLINKLGSGISHAIGTGGRDLSEKIGAITMLDALNTLVDDEETKTIVIISKPPAAAVREKVVKALRKISKPVVALFIGEKPAVEFDGRIHYTWTLEDTAKKAVEISQNASIENSIDSLEGYKKILDEIKKNNNQRCIKGLYSGGTLAAEAAMLIEAELEGKDESGHANGYMLKMDGHEVIDLGDDMYTQGRPHPMIDPRLRVEMIEAAGEKAETAVILFDLVLGFGSHEDPAGAIVNGINRARAKAEAKGNKIMFVASICGTNLDPQNYEEQQNKLIEAGVIVEESNAKAVRLATEMVKYLNKGASNAAVLDLLKQGPNVINLGLRNFADTIQLYGGKVVQFDWKPVAGGNKKLQSILEKLK